MNVTSGRNSVADQIKTYRVSIAMIAVGIGTLYFVYRYFNCDKRKSLQDKDTHNIHSQSLQKLVHKAYERQLLQQQNRNNLNFVNENKQNAYLDNIATIVGQKNVQSIKIFLIGMMGAGKSTLAKHIANNIFTCNGYVYDTDELIESALKQSVSDIFSNYGEKYFRTLETLTLKQLCLMNVNNDNKYNISLIATGGGIVVNPKNWQLMKNEINLNANESFITIFIDIDASIIYERIVNANTDDLNARPLLHGPNPKQKWQQLLDARRNLYEKADIIIKIESNECQTYEIANKICNALLNYLQNVDS